MGYHTDLFGEIAVEPPMPAGLVARMKQYHDTEHVEYPVGDHSQYCPWAPKEDGSALVWDEADKPYQYVQWLEHLIKMFLVPDAYKASGEVDWQGQDRDDRGRIYVWNNRVQAVHDTITNTPPEWYRPEAGNG